MGSSTPDIPRLGHVAAALREAMTRLNLTCADINRKLGKKDAGVYNWTSARNAPTMSVRPALAKLLDLKIEDLTPREESPMPRPAGTRGRLRNGVSDAVPVPAALKPVGYRPGGYGGGSRDVLSFRVNAAGRARISLDVEMELAQATPLLRLLLDAGLVLGPGTQDA